MESTKEIKNLPVQWNERCYYYLLLYTCLCFARSVLSNSDRKIDNSTFTTSKKKNKKKKTVVLHARTMVLARKSSLVNFLHNLVFQDKATNQFHTHTTSSFSEQGLFCFCELS